MATKSRVSLLMGASLFALVGTTAAYAQSTTSSARPSAAVLGEVIVTAQRRDERYQDVAASLTVLNTESLAKSSVRSMVDLGQVVPGLIMPVYGSYPQPTIRGVSSNVASIAESSNVAVYVDGVYQAAEFALDFDLPDVSSIQVLKGPQGTLYGQNAAGGAIIIDTVKPSFTWTGRLSAGYGNHDTFETRGVVSGPISQTVAFSASGAYGRHDGYSTNLLTGRHDSGLESIVARGKLLWEPNSDVSFILGANYTDRQDSASYTGPALNGNTTYAAFLRALYPNLPLATTGRTYSGNVEPHNQLKTWGVNLTSKFKIADLGTLTSTTSHSDIDFSWAYDIDASPVNMIDYQATNTDKYTIEEVNFVSNAFNGITLTTGAFFMDRRGAYVPNLAYFYPVPTVYPAPPSQQLRFPAGASVTEAHKRSYAAYGEINWDINDQFSLTVAGRYASESIKIANTPLPFNYAPGDPFPALLPDPRGSFSFNKFTPKAVLRYKPDQDTSFYVSYSEGFKTGLVSTSSINVCTPSPACIDPPTRPETVTAYEVGYKGQFGDRVTVSAAAFHYLYEQIQVFIFNPLGSSVYKNAAAGTINGAEIDTTFRPNQDWTLHFAASYLDGKYTSFKDALVYLPNATGGNTGAARDVSGGRMLRTPELTLNGSIDYTRDFENAGRLGIYVASNYSSGLSYTSDARIQQKAYTLLDGEVSFAPAAFPGSRLVLWGKNLTDELYLAQVQESSIADTVAYAAPRTFGVRAEYKF